MPMRCLTVTGSATASRIAAHAVGDQRGLGHQAGAEAARLHALGRAAAVEIDLVVAPALAQPRAVRQRLRIAAAQLQRRADARPDRSRDAAARRRAAARRWSPSRCTGARAGVIRRRKYRQWRSVQSIIGAQHNRCDKLFILLMFSRSVGPINYRND